MKNRHSHFKKAFIGDVMTIIVFSFILGIVILIGWLLLSSFNTQFQTTPSVGSAAQSIVQTANDKYINLWDGLFGVLLIGMSLAAAISAYFVDTHPIVFALCLIILAVFIIASAAISNAYSGVEASAAFSSVATSFRLMHYILNNLGMYALVEGALISIALFTKARQ